jgi:ribonuclease Z
MTHDPDLFTLRTEHLTIEGRSRAGHESFFRVKELGVALDIGRCPDLVVPLPHVFVTHAHLDHSVGIPFYAGQRRLQRIARGSVYVPEESAADFRALMEIHSRMENTDYEIDIVGMLEGDSVRIGRNVSVRAHQATHRIAARAYEFIETRHHLRNEFAGRDGASLARLRAEGVPINEEVEVPILFYTGDTDRGILERNIALYQSEVLMIECSFIAEEHHESAAKYRHIHFDDIIEFADRFENRCIVLTHFSRRYSRDAIVETLRRRCPAVLRDRIRLAFAEPWDRL